MNEPLFILLKILEVMARFRSITEGQAIRLFPKIGMADVSRVLTNAVDLKLVARKDVYLPIATDAKIRKGRTKLRREIVFYMKTKGKELLLRENKTVRCLKTTRLSGVHIQRLLHDLIIVEVLIWWMAEYAVKQYWVEDELSSMGENKADLRVLTVGDDGSETYTDCEIVVQNNPIDIINKQNGMMWFTTSVTQKDTIEDFKLHNGVVLINLGGVPKPIAPSRSLTEAEIVLVNVLRRYGGALTAGAIAACLDRHRANISAALKKLDLAGHIVSAPVQLLPGQKTGSPHKVYAIDGCLIDTWADKEFVVRLSKLIEYSSKRRVGVSDIHRGNETAVVSIGTVSKRVKIMDAEAYA